MLKFEPDGILLWTKWVQPFDRAQTFGALPTADGGYILAGYSYNPLSLSRDYAAIKFDSEGSVEWSGLYGGSGLNEVK